jgi:hypothetical protein
MANQFAFPSKSNVLPQASGQIIEYIRKPKDFPLNNYAQFVETDTTNGVYAYVDPDQPVRIVNEAEFAWADGDHRPTGNANDIAFEWIPFRTQRRSYPYTVADDAQEVHKEFSGIDISQTKAGIVASQAMTNRTNRVVQMMQNTANWANNTADCNIINGGYGNWRNASADPTSPNFLSIKRSLGNACKVIRLATNGMVKRKHLKLILSLGLAEIMADTDEIYNYVKYGRFSEGAQRGEDRDMDEDGGLPPKLYGIEISIEDSPLVNVYHGMSGAVGTTNTYVPATTASGQRAFAKNDTSAMLVSRVGGIEGVYGAPSFSTIQIYFFGPPMQVEQFHEKKHRIVEGYVTEEFIEVLAAPASGFLFTNCS